MDGPGAEGPRAEDAGAETVGVAGEAIVGMMWVKKSMSSETASSGSCGRDSYTVT